MAEHDGRFEGRRRQEKDSYDNRLEVTGCPNQI
jgi:hypothetical protein